MEIIVWVTFALVIYLVCAMPTKKEVRRLAHPEAEGRRQEGLRDLLSERVGSACTLDLVEVHGFISDFGGLASLAGTVVDVDDEWVLVEATDKKGRRRLVAMRLDQGAGIKE